MRELEVQFQDITQAYIQGYDMERDVYMKPATEFKLDPDTQLKLLKQLYGLYESSDSWYHQCTSFVRNEMNLKPTDVDASLLFKRDEEKEHLQGVLEVNVGDKLATGNKAFGKQTDEI